MNRLKIIYIYLATVFILLLLFGCTEETIITAPSTDHTPTDVWWLAPQGGATLKDTVNLRLGWFDESGVDSLSLFENGVQIAAFSVQGIQGVQDYLWDTRTDSDGVYIWEARAWDTSGNMGTSPALLVRVKNNPEPPPEDHTPPVVTWRSPEPGSTVEGVVELRFDAMDDDAIESVKVYLNGTVPEGFALEGREDIFYNVPWITNSYEDGSYHIEVRAKDRFGNIGTAPSVILKVLNNPTPEPRVIWVPDDYRRIQDAINASQDGDTVRVRAGTYREGVRIMKRVWLESEEGPELTIIDAEGEEGFGFGIAVAGIRDTVSAGIRGFTIRNCDMDGIFLSEGASVRVVNNIILNCERAGIFIYDGLIHAAIVNNVIGHSSPGLHIYISTANISNNILFNIENTAFFNGYLYENPVVPDYNIAFGYRIITNNPPIHFGGHNIFDQDPMFLEDSFRLSEFSPGIDSGNPDILDPDGSRSDIGAYGGPHAYP